MPLFFVRSEFASLQTQLALLKHKHALLIDSLHLETEKVDLENTVIDESQRQSSRHCSSSKSKYDKCSGSTSEIEDDNDRHDAGDEESDEEDNIDFDTHDFLSSESLKSSPADVYRMKRNYPLVQLTVLILPPNPLLGETYEADYPDKGLRFFSEKVSHHPTVIACHCEGTGWKFWGEANLKRKFWGRSIQLDPVGILTLEFDDGEIFQWSKVTSSIYNLLLGKLYCDHYGTMCIQGNGEYSCKLKFKEQSIMDRSPHQVHGSVHEKNGKTVATLFGKWDESMHCINGDNSEPKLLWKRSRPS